MKREIVLLTDYVCLQEDKRNFSINLGGEKETKAKAECRCVEWKYQCLLAR